MGINKGAAHDRAYLLGRELMAGLNFEEDLRRGRQERERVEEIDRLLQGDSRGT